MRASCSAVKRGMSSKLMSESSPAAWLLAIRRTASRSDSVHFLFLISSDVTLVSFARRDDADDFFAMLTLPVCVNNQQHDGGLGLDRCRPDRVPALFSSFICAVRIHEREL